MIFAHKQRGIRTTMAGSYVAGDKSDSEFAYAPRGKRMTDFIQALKIFTIPGPRLIRSSPERRAA